MSVVFDLPLIKSFEQTVHTKLPTSRPTEMWQDHQISKDSGPMVHCLEM